MDLRETGPAYRLFHRFVGSANTEGWVKYGAPITVSTLAQETGVTRRTIFRWLDLLRDGGFIETANYIGRALQIRIAADFRGRAYQMPLFNGPQAPQPLRKTRGESEEAKCGAH